MSLSSIPQYAEALDARIFSKLWMVIKRGVPNDPLGCWINYLILPDAIDRVTTVRISNEMLI